MPLKLDDASLEAWLGQNSNREISGDYADWKLEPLRQCLKHLGLRQRPRPITVAGTKGKGSTVAFLESIYTAHSLPCLAFSSPHVLTVRERWRRQGQPLTVAELWPHLPRIDAAINAGPGHATYFERSFLLACCLCETHSDAVFICEVGLGGRLDCANALDAAIACITSLGLDHTNVLGPTLHHIAREKLAIARPDAPLLIAAQSPAAAIAIADTLPGLQPQPQGIYHITPLAPCPHLGLPGAHQAANAALAMAAAQAQLGSRFDPSQALAGLAQARLPARCQLVSHGQRRLLIDGAHTAESLSATLACAASSFAGQDYALILGAAADKDLHALCAVIPAALPILRCGYASPRSAGPQHPAWPEHARALPWAGDIATALAHPLLADYPNLVISGSFYLAGEALAQVDHPQLPAAQAEPQK